MFFLANELRMCVCGSHARHCKKDITWTQKVRRIVFKRAFEEEGEAGPERWGGVELTCFLVDRYVQEMEC